MFVGKFCILVSEKRRSEFSIESAFSKQCEANCSKVSMEVLLMFYFRIKEIEVRGVLRIQADIQVTQEV